MRHLFISLFVLAVATANSADFGSLSGEGAVIDTNDFYVVIDDDGSSGRPGEIETLYYKPYSTTINLAEGIYGGLQAGNFIPSPGTVQKDASYRLRFTSDTFKHGGEELPLATELNVSVGQNVLTFVYEMTTTGEVELDEGLEADFFLFDCHTLSGYTNGALDFSSGLSSSASEQERYYMNQRFSALGGWGSQNISIRNPFHSRVLVTDTAGMGGYFTVMFYEAKEPLYALPGPNYHSTLPAGYTFTRKIEFYFDSTTYGNKPIPIQPAVYFSPHRYGADGTIMFMWDELPAPTAPGPDEWDFAYTEDDNAPFIAPAIKTLNDHTKIQYVWLITPDLIGWKNVGDAYYEGTGDPDDPANWVYWHSTARISEYAPQEWKNWVKDIEIDNPAYPWMARVKLGNHGYHHSTDRYFPEGLDGGKDDEDDDDIFGHEFIFYNYERDDRLINSIFNDSSEIGLNNSISTMCVRWPGFKHTQSTIEAAINHGYSFACAGKSMRDEPTSEMYYFADYLSPNGEIFGISTTWWSDYIPDWPDHGRPFSFIQYTLDRKKPTLFGGHFTGTWREGEHNEASTARFDEFLTRIDDDYPMAQWEFPQDYQPFIKEMDNFDHIIVSQTKLIGDDKFECRLSFEGEVTAGETVIFEDGTDYELRYAYVDDTEVTVARRFGYYFIVLPNLSYGEHTIRLFNDESLKEQQVPAFNKVYSYPNPTDGPVIFKGLLSEPAGEMNLKIYTVAGDLVYETDDFDFNPYDYSYETSWRLVNKRGGEVASGVYICLWTAEYGSTEIKAISKMAVIK